VFPATSLLLAFAVNTSLQWSCARFLTARISVREAILTGDWDGVASLMDKNFNLRRMVYTEECIGARNLEMIETARQFSSCAKFTGSGGAVVGICPDDQDQMVRRVDYETCFF